MKKENRGGKRVGAGPPFKYAEVTCNITLRVPLSKKADVKRLVYAFLEQYKAVKSDVKEKGGHYGC
jgi:hypothetical protein